MIRGDRSADLLRYSCVWRDKDERVIRVTRERSSVHGKSESCQKTSNLRCRQRTDKQSGRFCCSTCLSTMSTAPRVIATLGNETMGNFFVDKISVVCCMRAMLHRTFPRENDGKAESEIGRKIEMHSLLHPN